MLAVLRRLLAPFIAVFRGILRFAGAFLRAPLAALRRLLRRLWQRLAALYELLLTGWNRIWQRGPVGPTDRQPTPGRHVLPLVAGIVTTSLWYLVPIVRWFDLQTFGFLFGMLVTYLVVLLGARSIMRVSPPSSLARWLITAEDRTGLIRWERIAALALGAAILEALWLRNFTILPAFVMLLLGFVGLLTADYAARPIVDDGLPAAELLRLHEQGMDGELNEGDRVHRLFGWEVHRGVDVERFDVTVLIDRQEFLSRQSTNPGRPFPPHQPDWTPWVVTGAGPEVEVVAAQIRERSQALGMNRFEEATAVLAFAQSITYSSDLETTGEAEYWRYPVETMFEQTGDCEDLSILAAAILRALGHHVLPLVTTDHAAIGIAAPPGLPGTYVSHEGSWYYYCESTAEGLRIGELPDGVDVTELVACPLREPTG